jgi:hypothetical protein
MMRRSRKDDHFDAGGPQNKPETHSGDFWSPDISGDFWRFLEISGLPEISGKSKVSRTSRRFLDHRQKGETERIAPNKGTDTGWLAGVMGLGEGADLLPDAR